MAAAISSLTFSFDAARTRSASVSPTASKRGDVESNMTDATALSEVLHPLQRLIAQLGGEAYVSSRDGVT
jgi:hypothetical protein